MLRHSLLDWTGWLATCETHLLLKDNSSLMWHVSLHVVILPFTQELRQRRKKLRKEVAPLSRTHCLLLKDNSSLMWHVSLHVVILPFTQELWQRRKNMQKEVAPLSRTHCHVIPYQIKSRSKLENNKPIHVGSCWESLRSHLSISLWSMRFCLWNPWASSIRVSVSKISFVGIL